MTIFLKTLNKNPRLMKREELIVVLCLANVKCVRSVCAVLQGICLLKSSSSSSSLYTFSIAKTPVDDLQNVIKLRLKVALGKTLWNKFITPIPPPPRNAQCFDFSLVGHVRG